LTVGVVPPVNAPRDSGMWIERQPVGGWSEERYPSIGVDGFRKRVNPSLRAG